MTRRRRASGSTVSRMKISRCSRTTWPAPWACRPASQSTKPTAGPRPTATFRRAGSWSGTTSTKTARARPVQPGHKVRARRRSPRARPIKGGGWEIGRHPRQGPGSVPPAQGGAGDPGRRADLRLRGREIRAVPGAALGLTATCSSGGAGHWPEHFRPYFQGASIIVLPDNDAPGREHAQQGPGEPWADGGQRAGAQPARSCRPAAMWSPTGLNLGGEPGRPRDHGRPSGRRPSLLPTISRQQRAPPRPTGRSKRRRHPAGRFR